MKIKQTIDGKREGLWREWWSNGQLMREGNYVKGEREGLWKYWYENGQLEWEGNYVNGLFHGEVKEY